MMAGSVLMSSLCNIRRTRQDLCVQSADLSACQLMLGLCLACVWTVWCVITAVSVSLAQLQAVLVAVW